MSAPNRTQIESIATNAPHNVQLQSTSNRVTNLTDALVFSDAYFVESLNICICKRITLFFIRQRLKTEKNVSCGRAGIKLHIMYEKKIIAPPLSSFTAELLAGAKETDYMSEAFIVLQQLFVDTIARMQIERVYVKWK